jgi:hypothetical protein
VEASRILARASDQAQAQMPMAAHRLAEDNL